MEITLGITIALLIMAFLTLALKSLSYVSDRPNRKEVTEMIDTKLKAVEQSIGQVKSDVKYIRDWIDHSKKRK